MTCSRRQFLAASGCGALLLGAPALLASCTARRAASPRGLSISGRLDPAAAHILWHAALAPSGHNTQPWEVKLITPDCWRIGIPPERRLPAVDPQGRETLISLGAFLENLAQAAAVQGLAVEIETIEDDPTAREVLDLRLVPGSIASADCLQRMQRRRVVKNGHRAQPLSSADVHWLEGFWPGQLHYLARGTTEAKLLSEGTAAAMLSQCQRAEAMRELAEWVRFGSDSVRTRRDGLTVAGMEIDGLAGWFVDRFYRGEDILKPSFGRRSVELTERLSGEGAGWLVLSSTGDSPAELIEAGRQLERVFLQLRERDIACHPMSQMLEERVGKRELTAHFGPGHHLQMLLRLGYLDDYPDPVSPRRPPEWFSAG